MDQIDQFIDIMSIFHLNHKNQKSYMIKGFINDIKLF
jgi:hypothetical protein